MPNGLIKTKVLYKELTREAEFVNKKTREAKEVGERFELGVGQLRADRLFGNG
jgi:hypothetical protein